MQEKSLPLRCGGFWARLIARRLQAVLTKGVQWRRR